MGHRRLTSGAAVWPGRSGVMDKCLITRRAGSLAGALHGEHLEHRLASWR